MLSNTIIKNIFGKTDGHCHFCGDPLIFDKYASRGTTDDDGAWELDHVNQRGKGGSAQPCNCLPACVRCNRLRWHRAGRELRELLLLGLIAKDEVKKGSPVGTTILQLKDRRDANNRKRRWNIVTISDAVRGTAEATDGA